MTVLTLGLYTQCVLISLFALFILICVHYCIDVVAVVVEIYSIQVNSIATEISYLISIAMYNISTATSH